MERTAALTNVVEGGLRYVKVDVKICCWPPSVCHMSTVWGPSTIVEEFSGTWGTLGMLLLRTGQTAGSSFHEPTPITVEYNPGSSPIPTGGTSGSMMTVGVRIAICPGPGVWLPFWVTCGQLGTDTVGAGATWGGSGPGGVAVACWAAPMASAADQTRAWASSCGPGCPDGNGGTHDDRAVVVISTTTEPSPVERAPVTESEQAPKLPPPAPPTTLMSPAAPPP